MSIRLSIIYAAIIMTLICALPATAQWSDDPTVNTPVCTASGEQGYPRSVSDGAGGTIVVWIDYRSGLQVYAQRLDHMGKPLWAPDGIAINTDGSLATIASPLSDGNGGMIVTWCSNYNPSHGYDLRVQRVDGSGYKLWTASGVGICGSCGGQIDIVGDGLGGAILAWSDQRDDGTSGHDIYTQRLDASGNTLWTTDGLSICTENGDQLRPKLVNDGTGGAIFTWIDGRSAEYDIYAQRVDASATVRWTLNGVEISGDPDVQVSPMIVSDDNNGAIISWADGSAGGFYGYFFVAQRVNSSGSLLWGTGGVTFSDVIESYSYPFDSLFEMVPDGVGGALIAWHQQTPTSDFYDVYAQRLNGSGSELWASGGQVICAKPNFQIHPRIVSDGAGGAIVSWHDSRTYSYDIYAQHIDATGSMLWTTDGEAICSAPQGQQYPDMVSDSSGGAIIVWHDSRAGVIDEHDLYAQRITAEGCLGRQGPFITMADDVPGDQGGMVDLSWTPSCLDVSPRLDVTHYSVWRRIPDEATSPRSDEERSGWSWVTEVTAGYLDDYSVTVPAYGIYIGTGDIPWTDYMVVAHTDDQWVYWESAVISGYSIDNLAPGAPLALTGTACGTDIRLTWSASGQHDEDLACYLVYRNDTPGFEPDESMLIGTADITSYTDSPPGAGTWHYRVTGRDVNGNEGPPSEEVSTVTSPLSKVSATLTCTPTSGIVPFSSTMSARLDNLDQQRPATRIAGRVDVQLANGSSCSGWRQGWTNVIRGSHHSVTWLISFPLSSAVVGENVFILSAADTTPAPYNQPPFSPSGGTAADSCTVIADAP